MLVPKCQRKLTSREGQRLEGRRRSSGVVLSSGGIRSAVSPQDAYGPKPAERIERAGGFQIPDSQRCGPIASEYLTPFLGESIGSRRRRCGYKRPSPVHRRRETALFAIC